MTPLSQSPISLCRRATPQKKKGYTQKEGKTKSGFSGLDDHGVLQNCEAFQALRLGLCLLIATKSQVTSSSFEVAWLLTALVVDF
tara:strand:+ start:252 stop:506 length:255 start_codon:yes stop_codon:yes gene_type:complete